MNTITIRFDGGCRPTNPGNKYGSYSVHLDDVEIFKASRIELGFGTNNEAEFESLLSALKWTVENMAVGGFSPSEYTLKMYSDSMILVNRINGRNKTRKSEPQRRMFDLSAKCLAYCSMFKVFDIEWNGREHNVARFGH